MELLVKFASTNSFMNCSCVNDVDYYNVYNKLKTLLPEFNFKYYKADREIFGEHFVYDNIVVDIETLKDVYLFIDKLGYDVVLTSDNEIIIYNDYLE